MAEIKEVLLAYDDSDCAKQALVFACDFVRRFGARLHIVSVCQLPQVGSGVALEGIIDNDHKNFSEFFKRFQNDPLNQDIDVIEKMEIGQPVDKILHYAETHKIDHIIIGHRGISNIQRWILGSVAREVIDNACCPVTVIREASY